MTANVGQRQRVDPKLPLKISSSAHHTCRMCANSCRNYDIMLTEQEARRLSMNAWRSLLHNVPDDAPLVILDEATGQYTLNKVQDEKGDFRCVFLDSDNLCAVHKSSGMEAKPIACQFFPLHAIQSPDGIDLSLNTGCRRLIEMTDADDPLEGPAHRDDAIRLLSQVEAITTIRETVPLTPDIDIPYAEFVEWATRLLGILATSEESYAACWSRLCKAASLLLTTPSDRPVPGLTWQNVYIDLRRLIEQTSPSRPSLTRLWGSARRWLVVMTAPGLMLAPPPDSPGKPSIGPDFCASIARQYLEGQQVAHHRTARTGWTALLAGLVAGMLGVEQLWREMPDANPDYMLNNVVSEALDLFFSPIGQLALTEPNQTAFLTALAGG